MTDPIYKQMTAFEMAEGIGGLSHTGKTYMGHLLAVEEHEAGVSMRVGQGCSTRSTAPRCSRGSGCQRNGEPMFAH